MTINYNQFVHPSDVKARLFLEKLPGFKALAEKYMNEVGDRSFMISNMSSNIKLGSKQMPEIYNLLPPICEKLGIEVPELYIELDRQPNAYTFGYKNTAIVLTSGLIENFNKDEIQIVLAHECGHILCQHTLYLSLSKLLYGLGSNYLDNIVVKVLRMPLLIALRYWERCAEFSADRVSAYFAGSSKPVVKVMMRLAGGTNDLGYDFDEEEYLKQAEQYKKLVDNAYKNKTFDKLLTSLRSHPLLAYRAQEISEWWNSFKPEEIYEIANKVIDEENDEKKLSIKDIYDNIVKEAKNFKKKFQEFIKQFMPSELA